MDEPGDLTDGEKLILLNKLKQIKKELVPG